jgi:hypothetical protein
LNSLVKEARFLIIRKKYASGAKARVYSIDHFAGDESPAYRPNVFFTKL